MSQNYAKNSTDQAFLLEALQWHIDHGAEGLFVDTPQDRTVMPEMPQKNPLVKVSSVSNTPLRSSSNNVVGFQDKPLQNKLEGEMMGAAQAIIEAQKLAAESQTLEALAQAIGAFEGLSIRKNATNMVFADGNPESSIMLIGEAPGADEDVQGKPFVGASGELLDRILACVGLSRKAEDLNKAVYISNVLNWRPPGNRTPTQAEMDISLPFIERHIALVQPKVIILCGAVAAKSLLRLSDNMSKLRGSFHEYKVSDIAEGTEIKGIPTIVTYHPAYLLSTPAQKKSVWADMLMLEEKLKETLT